MLRIRNQYYVFIIEIIFILYIKIRWSKHESLLNARGSPVFLNLLINFPFPFG